MYIRISPEAQLVYGRVGILSMFVPQVPRLDILTNCPSLLCIISVGMPGGTVRYILAIIMVTNLKSQRKNLTMQLCLLVVVDLQGDTSVSVYIASASPSPFHLLNISMENISWHASD